MFPNLKASLAPLILRWGLASIFLYHGYLKVNYHLGADWHASLPDWLQQVVAWSELVGAVALALGLLSRLAAVGLAIDMIGAILLITGERDFVHLARSFGREADEGAYRWEVGYEYNFAIIVMCCALLVLGSGKWSLDYWLFHGRQGRTSAAPVSGEPVVAGVQPAAPPGSTGPR